MVKMEQIELVRKTKNTVQPIQGNYAHKTVVMSCADLWIWEANAITEMVKGTNSADSKSAVL